MTKGCLLCKTFKDELLKVNFLITELTVENKMLKEEIKRLKESDDNIQDLQKV